MFTLSNIWKSLGFLLLGIYIKNILDLLALFEIPTNFCTYNGNINKHSSIEKKENKNKKCKKCKQREKTFFTSLREVC